MAPTGSRVDNVDVVEDPQRDPNRDATLEWIRGESKTTVRVGELLSDARAIVVDDPNHHARKRYLAVPLLPVLTRGLGLEPKALAKKSLVFEALDGYASPVDGQILLRDGAWLALDDLDAIGWEPVGEKRADPGPLYVVWTGEERSPEVYPWPWALARVRVVDLEEEYAATDPGEGASEIVRAGHSLFLAQCVRCHAVNRAGGRLGPELNVPQNITEYRPEEQIRAYIVNPLVFRYGNMPANPHLSAADLDALLAYFRRMKGRKVDPSAAVR